MSSTERDEARALEFEWRNNHHSILQSFDKLESLAIEATSDGPSGEDALSRLKTFEKAMQIAVNGLQIPIDETELSKATNISLRRFFDWSIDVEELRSQFEVLRIRARSWIASHGDGGTQKSNKGGKPVSKDEEELFRVVYKKMGHHPTRDGFAKECRKQNLRIGSEKAGELIVKFLAESRNSSAPSDSSGGAGRK